MVTSDELRRAGTKLFGDKWIGKLASAIGYERSQVHRFLSGRSDIPVSVELAIRLLMIEKRGGLLAAPRIFGDDR